MKNKNYSQPYIEYDQRYYSGCMSYEPIPAIEREKYQITLQIDWAKEKKDYKEVIRLLKGLASICHSQKNVYLLDCASYQLLEKAGRVHDWGRIPDARMEAQCLKQLARKYGTKLSEDKGTES